MADLSPTPAERLASFSMRIQGGLLRNLGINMYGSLGKCLVEFAANAYDGDSKSVDIVLDAPAIEAARLAMRKAAKAVAKEAALDAPSFIEDPLPGVSVVIRDVGHGMLPTEVQDRFLPINRDRRRDPTTKQERTEAGVRWVMGRKGIGKLSGFGAASTMVVRTKRQGETFATQFTLKQDDLLNATNLPEVPIVAEYFEDQPLGDHGTTLTLLGLKCDSMKFTIAQLEETLAEAFFPVRSSEFDIRINGTSINRPQPAYEYIWPERLEEDGMALGVAGDEETGKLPFRYVVKFRENSLPAAKRGARVYCNGRLAFGPGLLDLKTGTHNFMAHQYMECIVDADELDRQNVDLISTDRGDLRRDNDVVEAFVSSVTAVMQNAIYSHASFRDVQADKEIEEDPALSGIRRILKTLPRSQQSAGRKVFRVMVARYGASSPEFLTIAPLLVNTMSAGEVLVRLIEVASDPKDIPEVLEHLIELQQIERSDALKVFRGRRSGIDALRKLTKEGEEGWIKGPRQEAALHELLKRCPWLIRPELSDYVASDNDMTKVVSLLADSLKIDSFAPAPAEDLEERKRDRKRPDLVFVLGDTTEHPDRVLVVELKSPNLPLEIDHLGQLRSYMRKVEEWLQAEHPNANERPRVRGILIGAMPEATTTADGARDLLSEIRQAGPLTPWEVIGLRELLDRTSKVHRDMITALELDESEGFGDAPNSTQETPSIPVDA